MKHNTDADSGFYAKASSFLERRSAIIIAFCVVLTFLLTIPLLTMGSEQQASSDPAGETVDLRDDISERFAPVVHPGGYIAESRSGDILTQSALWELYLNEQTLRDKDRKGELAPDGLPIQSYLYEAYHFRGNQSFVGTFSIADAVQAVLAADPRANTTLENATDEQVKLAVHQILSHPETSGLVNTLSVRRHSEPRVVAGMEINYWTAPALLVDVLADNERLGGGTFQIGLGAGQTAMAKEEFNRSVQRTLRGDEQAFRLWGVAIDLNLEAADQGRVAGYFIMVTVIAVVLIAGLSLRSYWAVALTGIGLGSLMIWLKGISNLIGLKAGLVIDLIVPIAMIALGIDFVLHAMRRYREERHHGLTPGLAIRAGFAGVLGALTLAMASDSVAFLSNTSSGIESVIDFGIAAGIAMVSSFLILGVTIPLVMMRIDQLRPQSTASPSIRSRLTTLLGSLGVAGLAGTSVIFLVAVSKPLGLAVLLATTVFCLAIPLIIVHRRRASLGPATPASTMAAAATPRTSKNWLVTLVATLAHHRLPVLLIVACLTATTTFFATRLEATFDAKDFFDNESDFVVSLDKLDTHFATTGGEPGIIYVQGDLADPQAIASVDQFIQDLAQNPTLARAADGEVQIYSSNIIALLRLLTKNDYARAGVAAATGVQIADTDGDGLPDSRPQVQAAYAYMLAAGVPKDASSLLYTPGQVRQVLFHDPDKGEDDVTIITVGISGTREQQKVAAARNSLAPSLRMLEGSPAITRVGLTGSPFTRLEQLDATTRTLQKSLPIAAAATLLLLLLAMRSLRYAVVTIIPIGLVVSWLYGLMYLTGFALNYVTATIGAVSVGVGIDYSIYMTERFREEIRRASSKMQALRQATQGAGTALLAAAASSIAGFAIMGFAPMPMFSAYGILTALMIFLAMLAALVVLPSLLLLVTRDTTTEQTPSGSGGKP